MKLICSSLMMEDNILDLRATDMIPEKKQITVRPKSSRLQLRLRAFCGERHQLG